MIRRNVPQLLSELLLKLWRPQPATILSPQQTEKSSSQQRRATPHHGGAYVQRAGQGFGGPRALEAACRFDSETRSVARLQGMSINQQGCHLTDSRALVPPRLARFARLWSAEGSRGRSQVRLWDPVGCPPARHEQRSARLPSYGLAGPRPTTVGAICKALEGRGLSRPLAGSTLGPGRLPACKA